MRLAYFTKQCAINGANVLQSFLTGCRHLGVVTVENSWDCDAVVIWSMVWGGRMAQNRKVYDHYRSQGKPVFVLEVGMIYRDQTWKLGINGTTGTATWLKPFDKHRCDRLALFARPWQRSGSKIIVVGQRGDSGQWAGIDPESWYTNVFDTVKQHTDRAVLFRPHPRFRYHNIGKIPNQIPQRLDHTYDSFDFESALKQAWAVINFNSGPGSQAVICGIPAFVDQSSLAAPVANIDLSQIESPSTPDRHDWLQQIAHTEWTVGELAAGIPQKAFLETDIFHTSRS